MKLIAVVATIPRYSGPVAILSMGDPIATGLGTRGKAGTAGTSTTITGRS